MSTKNAHEKVLLVMDIQRQMMSYLPDPGPLLDKVEEAINNARKSGIAVVYVILSFQKGHPEIDPGNRAFNWIKEGGVLFKCRPEHSEGGC